MTNFFLLFLEKVDLSLPFGYFWSVKEGLLSKNSAEQDPPCKKKKAEEELLHNIDLEALEKETNLSLDEIAALSRIKDPKNLGKWSQGKPNGSRPNYNAIVRLLRAGATTKTLFGVDAATHQSAPEPVSAAPSPEFLKAHPELLEGMREQLVEDLMKKDLVPKDQVKDIVRQELERILPGKTPDKI